MGWVHRRRDHGGVIFIDLRDRDGITQVVFHEDVDPAVHKRAEEVRPEYVIAVEGAVKLRGAGDGQSQPGHRRSRSGGVEDLDSERIAHAAVPDGRRGRTSAKTCA